MIRRHEHIAYVRGYRSFAIVLEQFGLKKPEPVQPGPVDFYWSFLGARINYSQ